MSDFNQRQIANNQRRVGQTEVKEVPILTPEAVIAPTLLNSWVNYGSGFEVAGYWKDPLGYVHLRGLVKSGTVPATIFTLPVGYRPAAAQTFATVANDAFARITIDTAGSVQATTGSNAFFSLSGIMFRP